MRKYKFLLAVFMLASCGENEPVAPPSGEVNQNSNAGLIATMQEEYVTEDMQGTDCQQVAMRLEVMLSVVFHQAAMAVDTHVFRVSHRIGLVPSSCTTPLSVERMLTRHFSPEVLHDAHHWLILHGRYVCTALKPDCAHCGLHDICRRKMA